MKRSKMVMGSRRDAQIMKSARYYQKTGISRHVRVWDHGLALALQKLYLQLQANKLQLQVKFVTQSNLCLRPSQATGALNPQKFNQRSAG